MSIYKDLLSIGVPDHYMTIYADADCVFHLILVDSLEPVHSVCLLSPDDIERPCGQCPLEWQGKAVRFDYLPSNSAVLI